MKLRWWEEGWRLLLALAISAAVWVVVAEYQINENRRLLAIDLGLGYISFLLVLWRRRYPVTITMITTIFSAVSVTSGGPATLALVSLATRRRWREIAPMMVVAMLASLVQNETLPPGLRSQQLLVIPFSMAILGVTVGWGLYIGSRRELVATLHDRADRAEAEQSLRVSQARTAERARIAREMHDVMAHRISLVTMHAGALAYRDDLDSEQVRQTASLIQSTSHQALNELREVLGVLRADSDVSADDRPQPTGSDITELIEQSRRAGMTVRADLDLELSSLRGTIGRTLYRIVQESLTNANKHAPGTAVVVELAGSPGSGVTFRITNPQSLLPSKGPPSGFGLVGLTERAELVGGRLNYHVSREGSFTVKGWLPWTK